MTSPTYEEWEVALRKDLQGVYAKEIAPILKLHDTSFRPNQDRIEALYAAECEKFSIAVSRSNLANLFWKSTLQASIDPLV